MATRFKRTRLVDRAVQNRDARIYVIATEGRRTEPAYFRGLQEGDLIDRTRVKIVVEPTLDDGRSAPNHVLARLEGFAAQHNLLGEDELWLVSDLDRWPEPMLSRVAQQCHQKGYHVALSNPCFELWLLLHHTDRVEGVTTPREAEEALRRAFGGYNKSNLDTSFLTEDILRTAVERARTLDTSPQDRWPQTTGTRVYLLVENLLDHRRAQT